MLQKRIREILDNIIDKSPYDVTNKYYLKFVPEERRTFHGKFVPKRKELCIYNLSRPTDYIISTTIHELAHYVEFSLHQETGHSKRFYEIYFTLLCLAIEYGYINYDIVRYANDVRDITMLEKYCGTPKVEYNSKGKNEKINYIIAIKNGFDIRDMLKNSNYKYNAIEQLWEKEVDDIELKIEIGKLSQYPNIEYEVSNKNSKKINAIYYLEISGQTYENKDKLKELGYKYNGYGRKDGIWVKKIYANNYDNELAILKKIPKIKITTKSNFCKKRN